MGKKPRTFELDYEKFQSELLFSHARTKLLELEWVNQTMIESLFTRKSDSERAMLDVRDKIYDRIDEYKKILVKQGVKDGKDNEMHTM